MRYAVWVVCVLAACGRAPEEAGDDGAADDAATPATCEQLYDSFAAAAESLDDSCDVPSDCTIVGGQLEEWTCDCAVTLPQVAINDAAYAGSDAAAIRAEYAARCNNESGVAVCDAPPSVATCVNGHCGLAEDGSCWGADAGVAP